MAVPDALATPWRQRSSETALKRTISGSVARPRETFSTTPYVTQARLKMPNANVPSERATYRPTAKFVRLETAWSPRPQLSRPAMARTAPFRSSEPEARRWLATSLTP